MASSAGEEYSTTHLGYIVVDIVLLLGGLTVQSFIVFLNLIDQMKGKLMTATDQVITSLGISRFCFHLASVWFMFQFFVFKSVPVMLSMTMSFIAWLSTYSGMWLSVLLSAFLCLKICIFHNVLFLRLRAVISQKAVHVIVLSVLLCWCYMSLIFTSCIENPNNSTEASAFNQGIRRPEVKIFLFFLWNITCLLIYLLSSVLIIVSLCLHMIRMKTQRSVACKIDVYIKTLTFVIVSLLTFVTFAVINQLGDYLLATFGLVGIQIICNIVPLFHSVYLICVTAKLRNQLLEILQSQFKCLVSRHSEPDSGGPVEMITQ